MVQPGLLQNPKGFGDGREPFQPFSGPLKLWKAKADNPEQQCSQVRFANQVRRIDARPSAGTQSIPMA